MLARADPAWRGLAVDNSSDYSGDLRASSLHLQRSARLGGPVSVQPFLPRSSSETTSMSDYGRNLLDAAAGLRAALESAGDGLAAANLGTVLDSEIALAAALAVLPTERGRINGERDEILQELARARAALTRCRRLGGALSEMVRATMRAQGRASGYGADGRQAPAQAPGALEARG